MGAAGFYFFKSLSDLYRNVLKESVRGYRRNLCHYFLHLSGLAATAFVLTLIRPAPGFLGALLSGVVFSIFLSVYLSSVSSAVNLEAVSLRETMRRALSLFPRVLNVLFIFFLITTVLHVAVRRPVSLVLANIVLAVVWNAILEASYLEDAWGAEIFRRAARFVYDNTLEWFLPIVVFALAFSAAFGAEFAARALVLFLATHPLQFVQILLAAGGKPELVLAYWKPALAFILLLYPVFIFRGILYKHLGRSNRRKRIFEAKF